MADMNISQNKAPRKKKTRHVLDASLNAPASNGFSHSQFLSQGTFSREQQGQVANQPPIYEQGRMPEGYAGQPQGFHAQQSHQTQPQTDMYAPRNQLEVGQFPSVQEDIKEAVEYYRTNVFYTGQASSLNPPANIDFVAIDSGVSSPKFARLSMGSVPATEEVLTASQLPLSLAIQPLADLAQEEGSIPRIDSSQESVPRCHRCRTYMNPSMEFINGGAKYSCNICGFANETPAAYYSPLDISGKRQDWNIRPELQYGTCDFIMGKEYWAREKEPTPLHILFAIDVSEQALLRDMPKAVTHAIWQALYGEDSISMAKGTKIAILTFDRSCHFYNLTASLGSVTQMMSVPDVDDMFVPLLDGLFADPAESRVVIESTLTTISTAFAKDPIPEPALGALSRAAWLAMSLKGGRMCLFLGALPTWGPGKLRMRENTSLYNTPEEKSLYDAASAHWKNIADEFVNIGVGIDCFLFPSSYIDVATVGLLAHTTGGDLFYYQNFINERDGVKFDRELQRALTRSQGTAVQMKLRCSNGLKVVSILGGFVQKGPADLEMGSVDADKSVTFTLKHDGKLDPQREAHFQSAILFTDPGGQRILRTHNIRVAVTLQIGEVLRHCDAGAAVVTIAKLASVQVLKAELKVVKSAITDQCVRILAAYRRNCAIGVPAGELILPESLKLLPLLALAVQKQFSFRTDSINSDVRVNNQRLIRRGSVRDILSLIYPRLIPIHALTAEEGFADDSGHFRMPSVVRNSFSQLNNGGAYILDNGQTLYLWFKSDVTPALLQDLYGEGCHSLESLRPRVAELPVLDTLLNTQVRNIIAYLNTFSTSRHLVPQMARQSFDGSEMIFAQGLVDDRNCDNLAYPDFLIHVHKHVQILLAESQQSKGLGSWITGTEQAY